MKNDCAVGTPKFHLECFLKNMPFRKTTQARYGTGDGPPIPQRWVNKLACSINTYFKTFIKLKIQVQEN
jgi:hypothetical protein